MTRGGRRAGLSAAIRRLVARGGSTLPRLDHPLDQTPLADSPVLAHLAAALPAGAKATAADLLADRAPAFVTAPDPSALFRTDVAPPHTTPAPGAVQLRVLTYNTALLDRSYLGGRARMPHVPARRMALPSMLLGDGWDVLLLQEVWEDADVDRFLQEARRRGYRGYGGSRAHHRQHGLLILVRAALISGPEDRQETQFGAQRRVERWPGPNIKRGYLSWSFTHTPTGQALRLVTTHPQAFPGFWRVRSLQARQLGLDIHETNADTIVLLGADLNAGPYYPHDTFGAVKGAPVRGWWRNAVTWPLLRHYGGLTDVAGTPQAARDVEAMTALPPWSSQWVHQPLGGACAQVPPGVFSATDCNTLYFANYAGEEYPARLDHLLLRDPGGAVQVLSCSHAYVQPEAFASGVHEPSDHYGVSADLRIAPK